MSKITQGPWSHLKEVRPYYNSSTGEKIAEHKTDWIVGPGDVRIAVACTDNDISLMTAAPDMLELLKVLLPYLRERNADPEYILSFERVLTKAEGGV